MLQNQPAKSITLKSQIYLIIHSKIFKVIIYREIFSIFIRYFEERAFESFVSSE